MGVNTPLLLGESLKAWGKACKYLRELREIKTCIYLKPFL